MCDFFLACRLRRRGEERMLGRPQTPSGQLPLDPAWKKRAHRVNYSGTRLAPPAAAREREGNGARTPRAPARLAETSSATTSVPRHPLLNSYRSSKKARALPAPSLEIRTTGFC